MPGSIEKACPARAARSSGDEVRILVLLEADAVTGAVDEAIAGARRGDGRPGDGVDRLARRADHGGRRRAGWASWSTAYSSATATGGSPVHTQRVMSEQ